MISMIIMRILQGRHQDMNETQVCDSYKDISKRSNDNHKTLRIHNLEDIHARTNMERETQKS